ncbi:MAG: hypothetical protein N3A53_05915 [Verrucomicrobiae bacterium]|nr:hypothetical protein [Verrucomicrobiae bacterium]
MRWAARIVALLVVIGVGWWLANRLTVTEEQRLLRTLSAMQRAVERNNLLTLEAYIANDYSDDLGLDKHSLLLAVRNVRMQYRAFVVLRTDTVTEIAPHATHATVTFVAKVLATPTEGAGEIELFTERFRLFFRKQDNAWRLRRVEVPKLTFE